MFNLVTGIVRKMGVKQTRAVIYYFVRYSVIMDKNKTATVGETGVMLGHRKRRVFTAHSSVFSLLSLQVLPKNSE